MKKLATILGSFVLLFGLSLSTQATETIASETDRGASKALKLVVLITVDQLRGDLPMRYRERLETGGFRYLMEQEFGDVHKFINNFQKQQIKISVIPEGTN